MPALMIPYDTIHINIMYAQGLVWATALKAWRSAQLYVKLECVNINYC